MQRKGGADPANVSVGDQEKKKLFATNNNINNNSNSNSADGNLERKRDHTAISSQSSSSSSNDNTIILQLASVVDMYGVGSDIIGRRSFGGFHKSVRTTWDTALKSRTDSAARVNNTRSHVTDEELLERYERYVKGGGNGGAGGGGRDNRKQKRKR